MRLLVAIAITLATVAPAAADPEDAPAARPYTTPLTPTGELLHGGEFQRSWNLAMAADVAVGITDRLELRLHGHVVLAGDLALRAAVVPTPAFPLVVGA